ncbi:MAG TPA: helix-turn-helix domain-containing protein, partial [Candidatus Saccharimonadia bacterium]
MNEEIISQVEELGLSNKEARVYIANLMLGPAGVQQIADASGIKRVTTYVILESLVNLGLVSQTSKAKKTLFNAESPEHLRRLLQRREQSLQDQKQQLEELMPELKNMKSLPKDVPSVKFYDSAEGIRTAMKTVIDEARADGVKQLYGMSNLDQLHAFFPEIAAESSNPERVAAGIASQYIYTSTRGRVYLPDDRENNRHSCYVPIDQYPLNGDMTVV